jgi:hypothetical protein
MCRGIKREISAKDAASDIRAGGAGWRQARLRACGREHIGNNFLRPHTGLAHNVRFHAGASKRRANNEWFTLEQDRCKP